VEGGLAIPTTGARASARAASNPVSSKQATTCHHAALLAAGRSRRAAPGTASASS